jgi:hypothetical protein
VEECNSRNKGKKQDVMNDNDQDDFEDDDEKPDIEDLFPFRIEERELIDQLATKIRASLKKLAPVELRRMATFLFALERLPYATPGISFDLVIARRLKEDLSYISVEITDNVFQLFIGGSIYSPGIGSDSYSETNLYMETGGFRLGTTQDFEDWLCAFCTSVGSYSFEETDDDNVDLTEEVPGDGWDRLAAYWESQGWNEYGY